MAYVGWNAVTVQPDPKTHLFISACCFFCWSVLMSKSSTRREDSRAVDSMEMSPFSFSVGCDFSFRLFGLDPRMLLHGTGKRT